MVWDEFSKNIAYLSESDLQKVHHAFAMGERAHAGQIRQSGHPYFTHPIMTAVILARMKADGDTLAAALLHDTVEDTDLTVADIAREFNPAIADLVRGITKLCQEDIANHPSLDERIETLRKMFLLMQQDVRIMLIKLSDRLHNMQTLKHRTPEKQRAVAKETMDVYVKIADRLCMRDLRDELEELCLAALDPTLHAALKDLRKQNILMAQEKMKHMREQMLAFRPDLSFECAFDFKSWANLHLQYDLMRSSTPAVLQLNIALLCDSVDSCYRTLGVIHQLWPREVLTFEDFINAPAINGYRGIHTTILLEKNLRIRCKIRTKEMDVYAHRGIAAVCFASDALGIQHYLPWTQRISPLAKDTKDRSQEFWETLQSDILSESMVIHGLMGKSAMVPKGATALDGVFYFIGKDALRAQTIHVDGITVPFYEKLQNASTVTAVLAEEPQVQLQWLQFVHTGTASAMIRQELVKAPKQSKETVGKELFAASIRQYGQVDVEELAPGILRKNLAILHVGNLSRLYASIAEGKIDPDRAARSFFPKRKTQHRGVWLLRARLTDSTSTQLERALKIFPSLFLSLRTKKNEIVCRARYELTDDQAHQMQSHLQMILPNGQWSLVRKQDRNRLAVMLFSLILLWGLDPVFAYHLLAQPLDPFSLTFIRFVTFFCISSLLFLHQSFFQRKKLRHLSPFQPSLFLSGLALFVTAVFTYAALAIVHPVQYIIFVIGGIVLTKLIRNLRNKEWTASSGMALLLLIAGVVAMNAFEPMSLIGSLAAAASSLGFALYSEVSRRYQEEVAVIHARYPAFLFWISFICLVLSAALAPVMGMTLPSSRILTDAVLFVLVFAVLPYILFFESMRHGGSRLLEYTLPLVFVSTMLGDILFLKHYSSLFATPLLLVFLLLYWKRKETEV